VRHCSKSKNAVAAALPAGAGHASEQARSSSPLALVGQLSTQSSFRAHVGSERHRVVSSTQAFFTHDAHDDAPHASPA